MSFKTSTAAVALVAAVAAPLPARAFTGPGGCSGLPEYYRALGALQGGMESACAMSVAQARDILSAYGGVPGEAEPELAPPRVHRRHRAPVR